VCAQLACCVADFLPTIWCARAASPFSAIPKIF